MPTPTYTQISSITLAAATASVTFSSISQAYRDLILVVNGTQSATSGNGGFVRFNGDTGANYSYEQMHGTGSATGSTSGTGDRFIDSMVFANTPTAHIFQIMDYSATDKHKILLSRVNVSDWGTRAYAGRWANTAAVTTISLGLESAQQFIAGSVFTLYGIVG